MRDCRHGLVAGAFHIAQTNERARPDLIATWRQFERLLEGFARFHEPALLISQVAESGQRNRAVRIPAGNRIHGRPGRLLRFAAASEGALQDANGSGNLLREARSRIDTLPQSQRRPFCWAVRRNFGVCRSNSSTRRLRRDAYISNVLISKGTPTPDSSAMWLLSRLYGTPISSSIDL
jgi:hypothetical protein